MWVTAIMPQAGSFSGSKGLKAQQMRRKADTQACYEVLEPKLPMAGDVSFSRSELMAPEVVLINNAAVGPAPITFERADFLVTVSRVLWSAVWRAVWLKNSMGQPICGGIFHVRQPHRIQGSSFRHCLPESYKTAIKSAECRVPIVTCARPSW